MGDYKIDNYANEQFGNLWKESRKQQAFDLGYARGMFEIYRYFAMDINVETADKIFQPIANANKHFQKYLELYKEEDTQYEKLSYKYQKYKTQKEQMENKLKEDNLRLVEMLDEEYETFEKSKQKELDAISEQIRRYKKIIEMKKKSMQDMKFEIL